MTLLMKMSQCKAVPFLRKNDDIKTKYIFAKCAKFADLGWSF